MTAPMNTVALPTRTWVSCAFCLSLMESGTCQVCQNPSSWGVVVCACPVLLKETKGVPALSLPTSPLRHRTAWHCIYDWDVCFGDEQQGPLRSRLCLFDCRLHLMQHVWHTRCRTGLPNLHLALAEIDLLLQRGGDFGIRDEVRKVLSLFFVVIASASAGSGFVYIMFRDYWKSRMMGSVR